MTIEKILCLGVGFLMGVMFSVIGFVLLSDWLDEREKRGK